MGWRKEKKEAAEESKVLNRFPQSGPLRQAKQRRESGTLGAGILAYNRLFDRPGLLNPRKFLEQLSDFARRLSMATRAYDPHKTT